MTRSVTTWREPIDNCRSQKRFDAELDLAAMKLVVNQADDNMGLQTTQTLGPILDGIMRNTPDGRAFVRLARDEGVRNAVAERDGPFGDYSQGSADERPRKRSELTPADARKLTS